MCKSSGLQAPSSLFNPAEFRLLKVRPLKMNISRPIYRLSGQWLQKGKCRPPLATVGHLWVAGTVPSHPEVARLMAEPPQGGSALAEPPQGGSALAEPPQGGSALAEPP